MKINQSPDPVAIRQESSTASFSGVTPQVTDAPNPNIECVPVYRDGYYQYANPNDVADNDLAQGGLIDIDDKHPSEIAELRAPVSVGLVTLVIEERVGTNKHPTTVHSAVGGYTVFNPPIPILASQILKITTINSGWVDVYIVKATPL